MDENEGEKCDNDITLRQAERIPLIDCTNGEEPINVVDLDHGYEGAVFKDGGHHGIQVLSDEEPHIDRSVQIIIHQGLEDELMECNTVEVEVDTTSDAEELQSHNQSMLDDGNRFNRILSYETGRDGASLQDEAVHEDLSGKDTKDKHLNLVGIEDVQGIDVICGVCGKHFQSLGALSTHLSLHHSSITKIVDMPSDVDEEIIEIEAQSPNKPSPSTSLVKHKCPLCSKRFSSERLLLRHSRTCKKGTELRHVKLQKSAAGTVFETKALSVPLEEIPISALTCEICQKIFTHLSALHVHLEEEHQQNGEHSTDDEWTNSASNDSTESEQSDSGSSKKILKVDLRCSSRINVGKRTPSRHFVSEGNLDPFEDSRYPVHTRTCKYCNKILSRPTNMRKHIRKVHENPVKSADKSLTSLVKVSEKVRQKQVVNSPKVIKNSIKSEIRSDAVLPFPVEHLQNNVKEEVNEDCGTVVVITNKKIQTNRPVQCPECLRMLSSTHSLMEHMRTHTGEKPFHCEECDRAFATPRNLKKHRMSVHSGLRPFKCNECGKDFALKSSLKAHSHFHTNTFRYRCVSCAKGFQTPASLKRHELIHTDERPYACDQCGKRFNDTSALKKHMFYHTGLKPFICEKCGCGFATASSLRYHDLVHTGVSAFYCAECDKHFRTNSSLQRHQRIHSGVKPFQCDFCGLGFAERWQLVSHRREHTGERPFECDQCGKRFVSLRKLTRHMHVHNPRHLCNVCGKCYTAASFLKTHMYKHTGEHPHHCKKCPKRFATGALLRRHETTHEGLKPHVCEWCGKRFTSAIGLKNHTTLHTGDRPFVCESCGKGFPNKAALKIHEQFHSTEKPHECDICSRRFHRVYELNHHRVIHNEEKLFKCHLCNKGYHYKSTLDAHINTHTEEKWYKCDECDKSFLREATLKKHLKIHAAVKPHPCDHCAKRFVRKEHLRRHLSTHAVKVIEFGDPLTVDNIMNLEDASIVAEHVEMDLNEEED